MYTKLDYPIRGEIHKLSALDVIHLFLQFQYIDLLLILKCIIDKP